MTAGHGVDIREVAGSSPVSPTIVHTGAVTAIRVDVGNGFSDRHCTAGHTSVCAFRFKKKPLTNTGTVPNLPEQGVLKQRTHR
jgi:hypothetical protein